MSLWIEPCKCPKVGERQNLRVMNDDVMDVFRLAAGDRSHGAVEIETNLISALLALRTSWTANQLATGAGLLADEQPAMAPLTRLAERLAAGDLDDIQSFLEERLRAVARAPEILADGAMPWIQRAARVVTISRSSAVAAAVKGAWGRGWAGSVVVFDGSCAGRGSKQAEMLHRDGGAVSQPDAAAPRWLDLQDTLVAVGADAVAPSRFINCIGTLMLLELAAARNIPVILLADSGKDVSEAGLDAIVQTLPRHREGPAREWPLFEDVPMAFVTARISDGSNPPLVC